MTSEPPEWASGLGLQRHPEGGWFVETWRSEVLFDPPGYDGPPSAATAILFLLMPGEESAWHRVRSAELWFHHRGPPLELQLGGTGSAPADLAIHTLGADLLAGHHPQVLVPAGHWQAARPLGGEATLVSCVVAPGFDFEDFELL